jgi:Spy/CpxP family protein refolding chaperone
MKGGTVMNRRIRGNLILAAGLIGVLGLSSLVFAHGVWDHSSGWSDSDLPLEYRLTQDQAQEFGKIRAKYVEKLRKVQRQAASKQLELEALWSGPDANVTQVTELRRQLRDLDYRMEDLWLEANAAATRRLTPEQRSHLGDTFDVLGDTDSLCAWDRLWNRGVAMMDWSWRGRSRHPHRHTTGCGNCW